MKSANISLVHELMSVCSVEALLTRSECQHGDRFRDGHSFFAEPFISSRRMPPESIGQQHVAGAHLVKTASNGFLSSKRTCDQASRLQLSGRVPHGQTAMERTYRASMAPGSE